MHSPQTNLDDIVGLDLVGCDIGAQLELRGFSGVMTRPATRPAEAELPPMSPARLRHFHAQLSINGIPRPVIPSGLAHLLHLPGDPEPRTLTRARMAAEIERCVSAHGCVTRENLEAAGFTGAEIAELFTEARRIARVERMVS